jgi:hypothetical protein
MIQQELTSLLRGLQEEGGRNGKPQDVPLYPPIAPVGTFP